MEDVREAMMAALGTDPVDLLLTDLQKEAEGDLKVYLLGIDPEELGIGTEKELFEHLYQHTDEGNYSPEEVDLLLAGTLAGENAELLHRLLLENADGPLKAYLEGLDLEKEGITTPEELIAHLEKVAEANGFTMEDVREAMLDALGPDPVDLLLTDLQKEAEGDLKVYLLGIDPQVQGIDTERELFDHLYRHTDEGNYTPKEVDLLLARTLAGENPELLHRLLLENADGPLKAYLEEVDLEKEGITTPEELIAHLEKVAEANGFTMEDVREAMLDALGPDQVDLLLTDLQKEAEGDLKVYLLGIDPEELGIGTEKELFEHLYRHTDEGNYTPKEVDLLLAGTLAGENPELLHRLLLENADGPLKAYLEEVDLEKEGITTPEELIAHLEKVAEANGFTMEDVREAMMAALDHPLEVERVFANLLRTAEGDLKKILERTNLKREGIYTVEDLIRYIREALEENGTAKDDIEEILKQAFPGHTGFIDELLKGGKGGIVALAFGCTAGLLLLIVLWMRRRKKEN